MGVIQHIITSMVITPCIVVLIHHNPGSRFLDVLEHDAAVDESRLIMMSVHHNARFGGKDGQKRRREKDLGSSNFTAPLINGMFFIYKVFIFMTLTG